jgi:hypothetical protein
LLTAGIKNTKSIINTETNIYQKYSPSSHLYIKAKLNILKATTKSIGKRNLYAQYNLLLQKQSTLPSPYSA